MHYSIESLAPIVVFTYNRFRHTRQTLEALKNNELAAESELFIYSDGAKNDEDADKVNEVREYIHNLSGFKKINIVEREKNWGLENNIIDGVTKIVNDYDKIIVLEDDLLTSSYFLTFLNDSLQIYKEEKRVGMIHGHIYRIPDLPDLFFMYKAGCLGWGTWSDRWNEISFDGKKLYAEIKRRHLKKKFDVNNSYPYTKLLRDQTKGKSSSWGVRVYASLLLNGKLTFYTRESLVQHIGYDGGTHYDFSLKAADMDGFITTKRVESKKIEIVEYEDTIKKLERFYKAHKGLHFARFKRKFLEVIR